MLVDSKKGKDRINIYFTKTKTNRGRKKMFREIESLMESCVDSPK